MEKQVLSIGLLAYNEEKNILNTLKSLLRQSIFTDPLFSRYLIELVVVVNGTTDKTVQIATDYLKNIIYTDLNWTVQEIEEPGKANAWNRYVHEFSRESAQYLLLMDADIQFTEPTVIEQMLTSLLYSTKTINVGKPIKSIFMKDDKSPMEMLSCAISSDKQSGPPQLCGQLYLARASLLRGIVMPIGMIGEDGFLAEMIATENLTKDYDSSIMMTGTYRPSHTFEAYTSVMKLIKHEKEQIKSILCQQWLYSYLNQFNPEEVDLAATVDGWNRQDPQWLYKLCKVNAKDGTFWHIPSDMMFRRFRGGMNPFSLALGLMATAVDWLVFLLANRDINACRFGNYWR